ncbi:MAG: stage III sporulation protein AA [Lachnospiraceae bacterium]|nr:stage III sporulation protein AA [Lachnospiraceae bacterium]
METVLKIMAANLRTILKKMDAKSIFEIRLRAEKPLLLHTISGEYFVTGAGECSRQKERAYIVRKNEICETMEYISNYSLYAFEEEVRQGYITLPKGHRVGICGKAVLEGNLVRGMKYITCLNIRLAHPVTGCADRLMRYISEGERIHNTMIIAPPGCGKTTMLRDVVRQLSDGGKTVGVVDERSEIAACSMGVPQFDVGMRTDVLDCCPKAEGMLLLIRSMAPEVIAVDEIGKEEDFYALRHAVHCGCKLLATVHGEELAELKAKPGLKEICGAGIFGRFLILEKKEGHIRMKEALDGEGRHLT